MRNKLFTILLMFLVTGTARANDNDLRIKLDLDLAKNVALTNRGNSGDKAFSLSTFKEEETKVLKGTTLIGGDLDLTWNESNYLFNLGIAAKTKTLTGLKYILNEAKDIQKDVLKETKTTSSTKLAEHLYADINAGAGYKFNTRKFSLAPVFGLGYRKEIIAVVHTAKSGSTNAKTAAITIGTIYLSGGAHVGFKLNDSWEVLLSGIYKYPFNSTTNTFGIETGNDISGYTVATKEISQSGDSLSLTNGSYKIKGGIAKHFAEGAYGLDSVALEAYYESFKLPRAKDANDIVTAPEFTSTTAGIVLSFMF